MSSNLEEFLKTLGHPGRYQCFICALLLLNIIPLAFNNLNMVFIGIPPPHHCKTSSDFDLNATIPTVVKDGTEQLDQCHMYIDPANHSKGIAGCTDGWHYDYQDGEWGIVGEWDLVCERKNLLSLITTLYFGGTLIGAPVFGLLTDRYGRKPLMMIGLIGHITIGCLQFLSNSYVMFTVLKVIHGVMLQGMTISSSNLNLELFGPAHRTEVAIAGNTIWSLAQFFLVFFAFFVPKWHWFVLVTTLPSLIAVTYFWLVPESLRWLLVKNRIPEATAVSQRFVRINRLDQKMDTLEKDVVAVVEGIRESEMPERKTYDLRDLFRTAGIRKTTFVTLYFWFCTALIYYGISFVLPTLAGNKYINFLIGAGIELASRVALYFVMKNFGRRLPTCFAFTIAGVLCIASAVAKTALTESTVSTWLTVGCAVLGKAVISLGAACSNLLTLELFPTVIRGLACGLCGFSMRIGAMMAPQILLLGDYVSPLVPLLVFGIAAVVAGVLTLLLPETGHASLPDTIEDAEYLHSKLKNEIQRIHESAAMHDPDLTPKTQDESYFRAEGLSLRSQIEAELEGKDGRLRTRKSAERKNKNGDHQTSEGIHNTAFVSETE